MRIPLKVGVAITAIASVVRLSASGTTVPQVSLSDRVEAPAFGTSVVMDDQSGLPIVDVWINGRGPYPFVVGTAATVTSVTQDLANELDLTQADDRTAAPFVVDELRVGGATSRHVPIGKTVVVAGQGDKAARGILSPASFPGLLFVLDYPGEKLKLLPGALPAPDGQRMFEYGPEDPVPTIPVDIAGRAVDVQVDSNAPGGLTLPPRAAAELPLAEAPVEIGRVTDVLGDLPVSVATLNGIVGVGEWPLDIHSIIFCELRATAFIANGSIGARVLEGFIVTIDVKNHRVRFDRPAGS